MEKYTVPPDIVTVFGLTYCPYCRGAKKYLAKCNAQHVYIEIDELGEEEKDRVVAYVQSVNPKKSFPTVVFGDSGEVVVGFEVKKMKDALEIMIQKYPQVIQP